MNYTPKEIAEVICVTSFENNGKLVKYIHLPVTKKFLKYISLKKFLHLIIPISANYILLKMCNFPKWRIPS